MAYQTQDPELTPWRRWSLLSLISVIALVSAVMSFAFGVDVDNTRPLSWIPWWAIALLSYTVERYTVYLETEGQGSGHALSELPIVIGLAALSPEMLILARIAGVAVHRVVNMWQAPIKLTFNIVLSWFEISLLLALLSLLPAGFDLTAWHAWPVLIAAFLLIDIVSSACVALAINIAVEEKRNLFAFTLHSADSMAVAVSAIASIVMVLAFIEYPFALVLGLILSALLIVTYRKHRHVVDRYDSLRQLMRQIDDDTKPGGSGWSKVLKQMMMGFNARHAEIVILPGSGNGDIKRYWLGARNTVTEARIAEGSPEFRAFNELARRKETRFISTRNLPAELRAIQETNACLVAPMVLHGQIAGMLLLAGKSVGESKYTPVQLDQFGLFATRMSRAIEQDSLLQRVQEEASTLREQMYIDGPTGLPSESSFHETMHKHRDETAAIAVLAPVGISELNRTLGRDAGNAIILEMATRLRDACGKETQLYRHRGSRFIIRMPGTDSAAMATQLREQLKQISQTYIYRDSRLYIDVHAGVAAYPADGDAPDSILEHAGLAAEQAKAAHEAVAVYRVPGGTDELLGLTLKGDLADAIRNNEIELFFQPRIRLHDGSLVGAEALARWQHPVQGYVRPDIFIRIAEDSGLILELSRLVFRKALQALAAWHAAGHRLSISVNASAHDFREPEMCRRLEALLHEYEIKPEYVIFEITETVLMENIENAARVVEELHALGIKISIDDFGTGYSSFAYLARLPFDEIKIDRSFVSHMDKRSVDATVVETLIQLGHKLDLTVVAEGIESGDVLSRLSALGCDEAQGFFIARPMAGAAFVAFIEQYADRPALAN